MIYNKTTWNDIAATATLCTFSPTAEVKEYHAMIQLNDPYVSASEQFQHIETALKRLSDSKELANSRLVLKRYFVSDAINQAALLPTSTEAAISVVQQPPINRTKVAVWAYFAEDCTVSSNGKTASMQRPAYSHHYNTQLHSREKNELIETYNIFDNYTAELSKHNCTLKDNCIRTWIYTYGVDMHYMPMVNARKTYFEKEGLTDKTHYIASTGIEGKYIYADSIVLMDAYAIEGIKPEQITYLKGLTHLNPTIEYGVTFERATAVDYGDRRHIYVSGTASIDNKGEIVYPENISKQIDRTFENIQVLLQEGDAGMNDIAQMIVYLRDTADYELVDAYINKHYPNIPYVIVWAPVCRPGWLIEIECIAIKETRNNQFAAF